MKKEIVREFERREKRLVTLLNKCFQKLLKLEKEFEAIKKAYKTQKWQR